jgi:hypothetical protein
LRFACLYAALWLTGCWGESQFETAPVRGTVTYQDKPLSQGTIMFVPNDDRPSATGEIQPDGGYRLTTYTEHDGAVLGDHTVMITAVEDDSGKLPEERSGLPKLLIPVKYSSNSSSGLTAEVKAGGNTIDFTLSD